MPYKKMKKLFLPPMWWQYARSKSDFLLRVGPLSKYQERNMPSSHYPPPGYGTPPGSPVPKNAFVPSYRYGFFNSKNTA